jgi:hypothetical protein
MTSPFPSPPELTPVSATNPPDFPTKFQAVALLTPFYGVPPCVAAITYDWSVRAIRFQVFLLDDQSFDIMYTPSGAYVLTGGDLNKPPTQCLGPTPTTQIVPSPNWPSQQGMKCPGAQTVQGVECAWWIGLTKCTNCTSPNYGPPPTSQVANVFWFRADNGLPWRWMMINSRNPYRLPLLGEVAMAHFTAFEPVTDTNLPQILSACATRKVPPPEGLVLDTWNQIMSAMTSPPAPLAKAVTSPGTAAKLIPGLRTPEPGDQLPVWPDQLYLTSFTMPTYDTFPNQPYPTQVWYDWTSQNMLTRMFLPNGMHMDVFLDASNTNIFIRNSNGNCVKRGPTLPVGLPYRNWPVTGGQPAQILAVLDHNPVLGPNDVIVCFTKPSDSGRVFWAWYTEAGAPVLFMEVPQCCNVQLSLTDYYDWLASPPAFPPGLFTPPTDCPSTS